MKFEIDEALRDNLIFRIEHGRADDTEIIETLRNLAPVQTSAVVSREAIERAMDCIYLEGDTMGASIQGEEQAVKNLLALQLPQPVEPVQGGEKLTIRQAVECDQDNLWMRWPAGTAAGQGVQTSSPPIPTVEELYDTMQATAQTILEYGSGDEGPFGLLATQVHQMLTARLGGSHD